MDDHNTLKQTASKKRLMANLKRKFDTTMIGALACFEKEFGYLWGFGKEHMDLNSDELECRKLWETARTMILNNGNSQLRACLDELAQYTMTWDRYQTNFIVRKTDDRGNLPLTKG